MAMTAKLWTLNGLACELDRDRRAVGRMLAGVEPDGVTGPRKSPAYLMKTAVDVILSQATKSGENLNLNDERARQAKEAADKLEMENSRLRGELIPREDIDAAVIGAFTRVRSRLLSIPSKTAPLIAQDLDTPEIEHLVRSQILDALQELADVDVSKLANDNGPVVEGANAAS